ncbi:MAG TPA: NUDIX hydrolase, partial [Arachnia sp.]|nr:NUDIX hydrolase [Arachnia sp.]
SSSTRCAQTLTPYAKSAGLDVVTADVLTEEEGTVRPKDVRKYMARLLADLDQPTAICGHRPVLPQMFTGLGLEPRAMVVGEAIVLHRDDEGRIVAREIHKPTA